jgi:hypothetical protein
MSLEACGPIFKAVELHMVNQDNQVRLCNLS